MITIADEKAIVSLLEFAVGVEFAQIVIVLAMLLVNLLGIGILGLRKEKWQWVIAAMVLSQALLMTIENWPAI